MRFIIFFVAFCPCILYIYGRLVRLVRCSVSTDPSGLPENHVSLVITPKQA